MSRASRHGNLVARGASAAALAIVCGHALAQVAAPLPADTAKIAVQTGEATPSRPGWADLTLSQKAALAPLAPHWNGLPLDHKRKWLAISRNFSDLPADEQARIHGRMSAWAGLSTPERNLARINFAEARKLDRDEKKARWEAYQALSDAQRGKLAAVVAPKRPGAAAPARPVSAPAVVKLVPAGGDPRHQPRVGLPASEVDHNTLLPQHFTAP